MGPRPSVFYLNKTTCNFKWLNNVVLSQNSPRYFASNSLAPIHCLIAHVIMSSGDRTDQNISSKRRRGFFHHVLPFGEMLGCTDTQEHKNIVTRQLQTMSQIDRLFGHTHSWTRDELVLISRARLKESGAASVLRKGRIPKRVIRISSIRH
jgi:hypothetical protein